MYETLCIAIITRIVSHKHTHDIQQDFPQSVNAGLSEQIDFPSFRCEGLHTYIQRTSAHTHTSAHSSSGVKLNGHPLDSIFFLCSLSMLNFFFLLFKEATKRPEIVSFLESHRFDLSIIYFICSSSMLLYLIAYTERTYLATIH